MSIANDQTIFDLLEGVAEALEKSGQRKRSQDIKAGFARGTNGVDVPWLIEKLTQP